ncbi:related to heat shock transcription factor HSF21 [Rhynchosporium secalis]|uniref:Related to heat shock transcription factor HSF21 n=1 Tax=Rhynchosporium secalis TaxID=38038 RepID=A0A1E1LZ83_RHYSE|nr:related to heat shock transcription factor HSF21 [Rhynchosporium secalis]
MASIYERAQRSPLMNDSDPGQKISRTVPILRTPTLLTSAPSPAGPMDVTPNSSVMMAPPARTSPDDMETNGLHDHIMNDQPHTGSLAGGPNAASAAAAGAAGAQQPKIIQTAFIHKLYNMLEDQSIQHLISWSNSAESFVMSPSNDFSKVLSQYFKHTNISSFVRQLNMYGFHKVSDVFHTGSPDSPLWEFKHGNGSFKRGDLVGLREIKRRASRHALVHRDSYPIPKAQISQPPTPAEPMHSMDSSDRLTSLEHAMYEMNGRLQRSEDNLHFMHARNQVVMEALSRALQINHDMSRAILSISPNQESPLHRDVANMQGEIQRQIELVRSLDEPPEPPFSGSRPYFSTLSLDNPPVSPRQLPQDDSRRAPVMSNVPPRQNNFYRPPVPSHLSITPRRYGSIGANTSQSSPSSLRSQVPPPPPPPHPLATVETSPPSNLARRHTSADIRNVQGWQANPSPFASGQSSAHWPSSPKRGPTQISEEQHLRDSFSSYSLTTASSQGRTEGSRPATPPFSNGVAASDHLNSWSWGNPRDKGPTSLFSNNSGPSTRRGSMAHILNPAETAEQEEEHEEEMREEDRKRKRLQ